jgi:hypothetical protein
MRAELTGRRVEPPLACAEKRALIHESKQIGYLGQRHVSPCQIILGEVSARLVEQSLKGCRFLTQPPRHRPVADIESTSNLFATRFAIGQTPGDFLSDFRADARSIEGGEPLLHQTFVESRHIGVEAWQLCLDVDAREIETVEICLEMKRALESILEGSDIRGRRPN